MTPTGCTIVGVIDDAIDIENNDRSEVKENKQMNRTKRKNSYKSKFENKNKNH